MADKLDLLLTRMNDVEPKLDELVVLLKKFIEDEVASQVAAQLEEAEREQAKAVTDGNG